MRSSTHPLLSSSEIACKEKNRKPETCDYFGFHPFFSFSIVSLMLHNSTSQSTRFVRVHYCYDLKIIEFFAFFRAKHDQPTQLILGCSTAPPRHSSGFKMRLCGHLTGRFRKSRSHWEVPLKNPVVGGGILSLHYSFSNLTVGPVVFARLSALLLVVFFGWLEQGMRSSVLHFSVLRLFLV